MKLPSIALALLLTVGCATTEHAVEPGDVQPSQSRQPQLPVALQQDPRSLKSPELKVTVRRPEVVTLENGLAVYLLQDHSTPLVSVRLLIPGGGYDDPVGSEGLASLLGELAETGGTVSRSPEQIEELLEFHAADLSFSSADECSSMAASVRSADLAKLMPVIAELVQQPGFNPARFEVARTQFLEVVKRRTDRPDSLAARALAKAVFGQNSLFAREMSEASLKSLTVDALKAFHKAHWSPHGARLVITGDFDRPMLDSLLKAHWAKWSGPVAPARTFPDTARPKRRVILVNRDLAQVKVRIGGFGYKRGSDEEFSARLASTVLGSFGVGRLYKEIRDERGLAYSAFFSVSSGPTVGQSFAGFDARPDQAVEALEVALQIIEGAGQGPAAITENEIVMAKDMAINTFAFRFDTAQKLAWERALLDAYAFPDEYLDTFRERISRVKTGELNAAVQRLGNREELQIVIVGPLKKLGDLSRFGPTTTISDVDQFR